MIPIRIENLPPAYSQKMKGTPQHNSGGERQPVTTAAGYLGLPWMQTGQLFCLSIWDSEQTGAQTAHNYSLKKRIGEFKPGSTPDLILYYQLQLFFHHLQDVHLITTLLQELDHCDWV